MKYIILLFVLFFQTAVLANQPVCGAVTRVEIFSKNMKFFIAGQSKALYAGGGGNSSMTPLQNLVMVAFSTNSSLCIDGDSYSISKP